MTSLEFAGAAARLSPGDIDAEAAQLGVHPAIVRAVIDVESAGAGFLPDGRPKILFEAHVFHFLTGGRFGQSNISAPAWDRSLYGPGGAHQYERLAQAIDLDRTSALKSASWGLFQILGLNYGACGHRDVESFVAAQPTGERAQLRAFAIFVTSRGLAAFLQAAPPQFAAFARRYNGASYAVHEYDLKLAAAWRKWLARDRAGDNPAPRTAPDLHYATLQLDSFGTGVVELQRRLVALGAEIVVDGDFGPETMAAVVAVQKSQGLAPDGIVGPLTRTALDRARPAG